MAVEWNRHQQLEQTNPGGTQGVVISESKQLQRLTNLVVGMPAGRNPDPVVGASNRDSIEMVECPVLPGQLETNLVELALHVDCVRRNQSTIWMRTKQLAIELDGRDHRLNSVGINVDGAGSVGHGRREFDASPQAACPRQGDAVSRQIKRFLRVAGEEQRHV